MKRTNTEFYLNLYQKFHKYYVEEIIGYEIEQLLLEKYYDRQKIDIYGKVKGTATEVFIESMLGKSDVRHLKFILKLINKIKRNQKAIIIFQAKSFDEEIIETIISRIRESSKSINFYIVELSEDILSYLEELNDIHFLKIIDNIKKKNIKPFKKVEKYLTITDVQSKISNKEIIRTRTEERNVFLIKELRNKLYYFPTIYREKSTLSNRILTYGSGKSGITYYLSTESKGKTYIYIKFEDKETEYIYWKINDKKDEFKNAIRYNVTFDDKELTIRSDIKKEFIFKDIDNLVKIFGRYIIFLTNYILYLDEENNFDYKMISQHKEGVLGLYIR